MGVPTKGTQKTKDIQVLGHLKSWNALERHNENSLCGREPWLVDFSSTGCEHTTELGDKQSQNLWLFCSLFLAKSCWYLQLKTCHQARGLGFRVAILHKPLPRRDDAHPRLSRGLLKLAVPLLTTDHLLKL